MLCSCPSAMTPRERFLPIAYARHCSAIRLKFLKGVVVLVSANRASSRAKGVNGGKLRNFPFQGSLEAQEPEALPSGG